MGTLANISGEEAARAFIRAGWERQGQRGSHLILSKPGMRCHLTIPQHKELAKGTLRSLIRNAGFTVDQFLTLL